MNKSALGALPALDALPDAPAIASPVSSREEQRLFRLRLWIWGKQFAGRLKANALRMKQFLHAGS